MSFRETALTLIGLVATITACSCSETPSITPLSNVSPDTSEPVFDAAVHTMVYQDNMDQYTDAVSMGSSSRTGPRLVPHPSPATTGTAVSSNNQVIAGRGGSGKALRMVYSGQLQDGANFISVDMPSSGPDLATHYFQYWARVSFSAPPNETVAMKWFVAFARHDDNGRVQWSTHDHLPCSVTGHHTYWQFYANGQLTSCQGAQPVGPYFNENIIDNQWHRFTFAYRPHSAVGTRDGFSRMWIDGVKVIDVSVAACGVTPPGGQKPWCSLDDVDAIVANDGIISQWWGGVQTSYVTPSWTLDIDDWKWWIKPKP